MRTRRHAGICVVGERLFDAGHLGERRRLGRRPVAPREQAFRPQVDAGDLPERLATAEPETGRRPRVRERFELVLSWRDAANEVAERDEVARGSLRLDSLAGLLAKPVDVSEAEPDRAVLDR